ncbi:HPr family phosphocarrier protein [Desulfatitalea tepidiphila]|jgi:phosphocarrier protein|uniref:HPr family phosphocarrier protein n=1 Tax=Desulfatitalea tepidiphila TaxID=1185843 RepID=UPI0006B6106F|nr:HPr family phosphocarrier protein [Desulfatitalea tepidiphila]
MANSDQLLYRDLKIVNELGLHARSAAKLAKTAQQAVDGVWLQTSQDEVDAKQIIDILTLGAGQGDRVRVRIDDPADQQILDRIVELFNTGFGE